MEQDLATLQIISETLKEDPHASQRTLAKKANMSLGMMNAILGRFVERGWIMLSNVNGRKLAYAVTPTGIAELAERGRRFALRTFKVANEYNDVLYEMISKAKAGGKKRVVLYGESYIRFLLAYVCERVGIEFWERDINCSIEEGALCIVGEMEEMNAQTDALARGYVGLVEILEK